MTIGMTVNYVALSIIWLGAILVCAGIFTEDASDIGTMTPVSRLGFLLAIVGGVIFLITLP